LDLAGDLRDIMQLYNYIKNGQFSTREDTHQIVLVGGSVSTTYVYLLLREIENSPAVDRAAIKGAIMYGGLTDMYRYRLDWEQGALYIDPGIQPLEGLLIAFGRPDTRPELYTRLSTVYHVQPASLPPLLLVHAAHDTIVPEVQTQELANTLKSIGVQPQLLIYPNIEHYLDTSKSDPAQLDMLQQSIAFVAQVTKS
jgi:acetyl esterase/lipase